LLPIQEYPFSGEASESPSFTTERKITVVISDEVPYQKEGSMLNVTFTLNQEACIGCEKCAEVCPVLAIDFDEEKEKAYFLDKDNCIICRQCIDVCPTGAVSIEGALGQEDIRMG
jgi:NAD-dependent dihydropyrimidine dehydrogenase PreA subunit